MDSALFFPFTLSLRQRGTLLRQNSSASEESPFRSLAQLQGMSVQQGWAASGLSQEWIHTLLTLHLPQMTDPFLSLLSRTAL